MPKAELKLNTSTIPEEQKTMPSIDDFEVFRRVFEVKYPPSFLIWDRAGEMWTSIARDFEGLKPVNVVPNTTQFETPFFYLAAEPEVLRITSKDDMPSELFGKKARAFYNAAIEYLEIELLTRLGLRTIWRKQFETFELACDAFRELGVINDFRAEDFGVKPSAPGVDLKMSWEDKQNGVTVSVRTEKRHLEPQIPWEFRSDFGPPAKDAFFLVADVDCFTTSSVRKDQLDPEEWIGSSLRRVKKGISKGILQ